MTREQFDRLLSSYSSGKISQEEKDILFSASLENQEFFDALADEETLREVMADPSYRAELEEILEPQPVLAEAAAAAPTPMLARKRQEAPKEIAKRETKKIFWFRPWGLALAGTLGSAVIGTFIAWLHQKPAPITPPSQTAVMVAQDNQLKSSAPAPQSMPPAEVKQEPAKKEEAEKALAGTKPSELPAIPPPALPTPAEKERSEAADTVAEAKKPESAATESVQVQEAPLAAARSASPDRARISSGSAPMGFGYVAKRTDSIPRFTTKVNDGKVTLEVVQEGLLYVLATDEGNFRIIENGLRVNAGATRIIDPGSSRQLLIAITDKSIEDPNPVRLRVAASTKIITLP